MALAKVCPSCQAENEETAEVCFTCRSVLAAVTRGSVVASRYEVLSVLGRGGMGTVYEARDRVLDETVALKILRADVAGAPEMAGRFRSEIKLARKVSHRNVCRIYEYGEEGSLRYLAMERVEGANLKDVLKGEGPLPWPRAYALALQVADGLSAVHEAGIVHRDLKTLNIMVDASGSARVMDFGIAKRLVEGDATSGGYVIGSPEYMSPEQARGRPVDPRSDVYALGIVIYELFTGRVPFRGDTPVATLLLHLEAPVPLEGAESAGIPEPVRPVLRRALAKDPRDRFASAAELAEALRRARDATPGVSAANGGDAIRGFSGEPPAKVSDTLLMPPSIRPRAGRNLRTAAAVVAAAAIAIVVAFVATQRGSLPEPSVNDIASPPPQSTPSPIAASPSPNASPIPAPPSPASRRAVDSPNGRERGLDRAEARRSQPGLASSAPVPPSSRAEVDRSIESTAPRAPSTAPTSAPGEVDQAHTSPPPLLSPDRPSPAETPAASPDRGSPAPTADGALLVVVTPWADVSVDDALVGQTPLAKIPLSPGAHKVVLVHPHYQPFPRRVTIRSGETFRLVVDLPTEGIRRRR